MKQYAVFYGDWHPYWGSYTWQRLNGGHRALGDRHAVRARLSRMATYPNPLTSSSTPALAGC